MKKLIVGSILVAFSAGALAQGLLLEQGQSYVFEFNSITDLRPAAASDPSQVIAWFEAGSLDPGVGDKVMLEIFANSLSDTPLTSTITIDEFPSGRGGVGYWWSLGWPASAASFLSRLARDPASDNAQRQCSAKRLRGGAGHQR